MKTAHDLFIAPVVHAVRLWRDAWKATRTGRLAELERTVRISHAVTEHERRIADQRLAEIRRLKTQVEAIREVVDGLAKIQFSRIPHDPGTYSVRIVFDETMMAFATCRDHRIAMARMVAGRVEAEIASGTYVKSAWIREAEQEAERYGRFGGRP